ncbi:MAG: peptidoglycan DD-metalloendopeptidase family protein [Mediterranea sp.]|jgi:septal ring factor EnvC (AmiA/AmiB activator)|nr:peptidoglycan DD-metalloendopeptidase family protein [Mediterranea sp.]
MKRCPLTFIILIFSAEALFAQSDKLIKELADKYHAMQKEISQTEKLLNDTKQTVTGQLNTLNTLTGQIEARKRYMVTINNDITTIEGQLKILNGQLQKLQESLAEKKKNYETSVRYLYNNKTIQEKLMFILSAKNLTQTYRRLRYVREYADFQQKQGEEILRQQKQVVQKKSELTEAKNVQLFLLNTREQEKIKLEQEEQRKRNLIKDLQLKQQNLQSGIDKKKREANRLNDQIDKLVLAEMERVRKPTIETKKSLPNSKNSHKPESEKTNRSISQEFASYRGKLPIPLTGPSIIINQYGEHSVQGLKGVTLDNKGIDIQGQPGAYARAVFDGKVAAVFSLNGLFNILIRHGNYISVYCNLSTTSVKQDDNVNKEQVIGRIFSDSTDNNRTILHFQLRAEKDKLNPALWLKL